VQKERKQELKLSPLVSINIPTYNSEKTLDVCLQSVRNQTYRNIEIIVIDSHSSDGTVALAEKYNAKVHYAPTLAEARAVGVQGSRGKYILLLDSDQVLDSNVVEACVDVCKREGYDAVTLFERSLIQKDTFIERVIAYDKDLFHSAHDDDPIYGAAIPRFFKASYLKSLDYSVNPPITFEHSFIHNAVVGAGARVKFVDAYIYHHEPTSLLGVARKFYRYGYYYVPAFRGDSRLVFHHSLPRRVYFSKEALKQPILLVGLILVYFVKGISTLVGAFSYLASNLLGVSDEE